MFGRKHVSVQDEGGLGMSSSVYDICLTNSHTKLEILYLVWYMGNCIYILESSAALRAALRYSTNKYIDRQIDG